MNDIREIRHFHMCGAIGGGAQGFNRGEARVGNMVARARCIGSIDVDAAAIASEMFRTLLLAWSGETFQLSATPIWVRPVAVALTRAQGGA